MAREVRMERTNQIGVALWQKCLDHLKPADTAIPPQAGQCQPRTIPTRPDRSLLPLLGAMSDGECIHRYKSPPDEGDISRQAVKTSLRVLPLTGWALFLFRLQVSRNYAAKCEGWPVAHKL